MRYGFSGLNHNLNSNKNNNFELGNNNPLTIISIRVISIILDKSHPRFEELGGWNSLGAIEYELVTNPNPNSKLYPVAYPINPNIKTYPLVNEIVYLLSLPNTEIGKTNTSNRQYYINIISLWNHPHHNGYPSNPSSLPPSQQKDYAQTQGGNVRRVTDQSTEIFLGKTFKERSNIHPLLPFEGDFILEGRWGNSIRLGSTVNNLNNWSSSGNNGDPIFIIRNGQGIRSNEGWVPITEDINKDDSSIYLTSTQKIPIKSNSINDKFDFTSYNLSTPPQSPNEYAGKQIILNSGRLLLNSNYDHILLNSAKSINLNSQESVNIDTKKFIIQSDKTYLGNEELAKEPLLLGNSTVDLLNNLVSSLENLATALQSTQTPPAVPYQQLSLNLTIPASQLKTSLKAIKEQLKNITSKNNFTV